MYSFGTPSCVNEDLVREIGGDGDSGGSFITSVILHDDIIPRISPTSVRRLMKVRMDKTEDSAATAMSHRRGAVSTLTSTLVAKCIH